MKTEKRGYPRFNPQGLKATITLDHLPDDQLRMKGEVIDISYTGIKIKLDKPISAGLDGRIKIQLILPDSGIPLTISGIIKHQHLPAEYGLHYINTSPIDVLDDFILECVKTAESK
ncbi:MAG: PilZ domain-containing protein [Methylobacter sp.]|nr:PilZ domain-containing protein [Methylobacter sp.]